jgi:polyhydroxyalkanoate synthesis regulator phasin
MSRKIIISVLSLVALVAAITIGVVAYRSASASTASSAIPGYEVITPYDHGFYGGVSNEDLANALGITVDELNAAYQKAYSAALDQAVQDGLITQAQADQLRFGGHTFPFDGRWEGWLSQNGIDFNALLADALGITVEKLQAAYTQAYNARIDQAVTDGRLSQEQADLLKGQYALYDSEKFQSAMQSAFEAVVKQAVNDGVITQAQADQILQNGNGMWFHGFPDRGFGGFGGFGGFERHGWRGGVPPDNSKLPATPTTAPSNDA